MRRFENAKVGDKVYCRINGEGIISEISLRLKVNFEYLNKTFFYNFDGNLKDCLYSLEAVLFYRTYDNNYCEERPKINKKQR